MNHIFIHANLPINEILIKGQYQHIDREQINLITEEYGELKDAIEASDKVEQLDALVDILVVTMGAIRAAGWDGEAAWKEVMDTNFAKIDATTGKVIKRSDGKVLKPIGWKAPELSQFIDK